MCFRKVLAAALRSQPLQCLRWIYCMYNHSMVNTTNQPEHFRAWSLAGKRVVELLLYMGLEFSLHCSIYSGINIQMHVFKHICAYISIHAHIHISPIFSLEIYLQRKVCLEFA